VPFGNTTAQMGAGSAKRAKPWMKGLNSGRRCRRSGALPARRGAAAAAPADLYPALAKGAIDAAEWIGPNDDEKLRFVKIAPYDDYPGWREGCANGFLYTNSAKWAELPKAYQQMVATVAGHVAGNLTKYDCRIRRRSSVGSLPAHSCVSSRARYFACLYKSSQQLFSEVSAKNAVLKTLSTRRPLFATTRCVASNLRGHVRRLHDPATRPDLTRDMRS